MLQQRDVLARIGTYVPFAHFPDYAHGTDLTTQAVHQACLSRVAEDGRAVPFSNTALERGERLIKGEWERIEIAPFKGLFPRTNPYPAEVTRDSYLPPGHTFAGTYFHPTPSGVSSLRIEDHRVTLESSQGGGPLRSGLPGRRMIRERGLGWWGKSS